MTSMITTASWVPRGFAAPFPTKYNFDEAEFERIAELAKLQLDDANEDLQEAQDEQDGGVKLSEDGAEPKLKNGRQDSEEKDPDA